MMSKERTTAFTDAILAIIMTILVLELKEPSSLTWQGIWGMRESYFAYAISFFWLGTMWIGLHNEWENVQKISASTLWVNLLMLFWSSLFPYTTKIVSANFDNKTAQVMYGTVAVLTTLSNIWMSHTLTQNGMNKQLQATSKLRQKWLSVDVLIKITGIIVSATIYPPAAMISVLCAALPFLPTYLRARRGLFGK